MPWPGEPSLYDLIESVLDFVSNMDKEQKTMTIGEDYTELSKKLTDDIAGETCSLADFGAHIGTKLDEGKPRVAEMIQDFSIPLEYVAKIWAFGADKYSKGNWKYVENGFNRYSNAMVRHLMAESDGHGVDSESELLHAGHVAWNALARLHFLLQAQEAEKCK